MTRPCSITEVSELGRDALETCSATDTVIGYFVTGLKWLAIATFALFAFAKLLQGVGWVLNHPIEVLRNVGGFFLILVVVLTPIELAPWVFTVAEKWVAQTIILAMAIGVLVLVAVIARGGPRGEDDSDSSA